LSRAFAIEIIRFATCPFGAGVRPLLAVRRRLRAVRGAWMAAFIR
jgi:hypothetical protein